MSARTATTDRRSTVGGFEVAASAAVGFIAAAAGFLVSYLLIRGEVAERFENVPEWKGAAWYHYNAHLVDLESSGEFAGLAGTTTANLIAESGSTTAELLYLVPPLVLLVAGAALAAVLRARDLGEAVVVGAPIAVGYAVVMGAGSILAESSVQASFFTAEFAGSTGPELLPSILLAGLLYPLVFGTTGSIVWTILTSR